MCSVLAVRDAKKLVFNKSSGGSNTAMLAMDLETLFCLKNMMASATLTTTDRLPDDRRAKIDTNAGKKSIFSLQKYLIS